MKILQLDQIGKISSELVIEIYLQYISNKGANPHVSLHLQKIHVISKVMKSKQRATWEVTLQSRFPSNQPLPPNSLQFIAPAAASPPPHSTSAIHSNSAADVHHSAVRSNPLPPYIIIHGQLNCTQNKYKYCEW